MPITCARAFHKNVQLVILAFSTRNKTKIVITIDERSDDSRVHMYINFTEENLYNRNYTISVYTADIYTLLFRDRETDWHARLYNNKYVCFRLIYPPFLSLSFTGRQCLIRFSLAQ